MERGLAIDDELGGVATRGDAVVVHLHDEAFQLDGQRQLVLESCIVHSEAFVLVEDVGTSEHVGHLRVVRRPHLQALHVGITQRGCGEGDEKAEVREN